ncbi:DoxX family protein [Gordonia sp. NPDC003424]
MSERDPSAEGASSPYDEPTGQIPVNPQGPAARRRLISASERDEFYEQHAAAGRSSSNQPSGSGTGMARVEDIDDIDPADLAAGDAHTTPMTAQRPASAPPQPRRPAPQPAPAPAPQTPPQPPAPPAVAAPAPAAGPAAAPRPPAAPGPAAAAPPPAPAAAAVPPADAGPAEPFRTDESRAQPTEIIPAATPPLPPTPPPATNPLPAQHDDHTVALDSAESSGGAGEFDHSSTVEQELADARRNARRGTLDLGLLLLRVAVGVIALAHGTQKLFGWWNGPRLSGYEDMLANSPNPAIGFHADVVKPLAIVGALSETLGGLMLVIGLFTPIAAAAVLGVMLVAAAFKSTLAGGVWFFAADHNGAGIEYELLLAVCAAVIILTGPGRISLDAPRGWARRPSWGSLALLVIGIAAAVIIWVMFNGANPFESPGNPAT